MSNVLKNTLATLTRHNGCGCGCTDAPEAPNALPVQPAHAHKAPDGG